MLRLNTSQDTLVTYLKYLVKTCMERVSQKPLENLSTASITLVSSIQSRTLSPPKMLLNTIRITSEHWKTKSTQQKLRTLTMLIISMMPNSKELRSQRKELTWIYQPLAIKVSKASIECQQLKLITEKIHSSISTHWDQNLTLKILLSMNNTRTWVRLKNLH